MLALFGLPQVELGTALHDLVAVIHKVPEHRIEGEYLRHAVDEREHIVVEGSFERRVLVERV